MKRGWPESALLITVVLDEQGDGHAVLTVRTAQGDFVLDNKHSRVLLWRDVPYTFIKRQSYRAFTPASSGSSLTPLLGGLCRRSPRQGHRPDRTRSDDDEQRIAGSAARNHVQAGTRAGVNLLTR